MYLLYLYGETRVLLFDCVADSVVPAPELLVLMTHNVVAVLDGLSDLLFASLRELELHDSVVLELGFTHDVQAPLCLGENSKGSEVLVWGGEAA